MSEITAEQKFACPACGGESVWNAARQKMVCPFCGTESPVTLAPGGPLIEHDLVTALRGISDDQRGWKTERRQVRCQSCNAISVLDPARQAQNCEFCGSAQVVPYDETKPAFRPEAVLPFKLAETDARDRIRAWYGKLWFAPRALKRRALTDTVKGVYLPYWTFDAHVVSSVRDGGALPTAVLERLMQLGPSAWSLSVRHDDIRALCAILHMSEAELYDALSSWAALLMAPSSEDD